MTEKKTSKKKEKGKETKKKKEVAKKEEKKVEKKEEKPLKEEKKEEKKTQEEKTHSKKQSKKRRIAILRVYSSKNNTLITATDLSGAETIAWASGGMVVRSAREEGRPYAAMQVALRVINALRDKGFNAVYIKIRAPGGNKSKTPGQGAQSVVRTVARSGMRILKIEDVTPLPTDSMKRKGGRRGRRV